MTWNAVSRMRGASGGLCCAAMLLLPAVSAEASWLGRWVRPPAPEEAVLDIAALQAGCLSEAAPAARRLGFRKIVAPYGFRIDRGRTDAIQADMSPAARSRFRQVLAKNRLEAAALDMGENRDAAAWKGAVRLASLLGIPVVAGAPTSYVLPQLVTEARRRGVRIALCNTGPEGKWMQPEALVSAASAYGRTVEVWGDPVCWLRNQIDPVRAVSMTAKVLGGICFADVDLTGTDGRFVPPGNGVIQTVRQFCILWKEGRRPMVIVTCGKPRHGSRRDLLAASLEAYRRIRRLSADDLLRGRFLPVNMTWSVSRTWKPVHPEDKGTWDDIVKPVDLTGYRDATDGARGRIRAVAHGVVPKEDYPNLFDNKDTKWCVRLPKVWVEYYFPAGEKHRITAYTITSGNDAPERDPQDWRLLGSNDGGKTWTLLDERKGQWFLLRHQKRLFKVRNPGTYNAFRLEVVRNHGSPDLTQMEEIELLEPVDTARASSGKQAARKHPE